MLSGFAGWLSASLVWMIQTVWDGFWLALEKICSLIFTAFELLIAWLFDFLPEGWQNFLALDPFPAQLWGLCADVNWFIPFRTCLGIFAFTFGVCAAIRVTRWLLGIKVAGTGIDS